MEAAAATAAAETARMAATEEAAARLAATRRMLGEQSRLATQEADYYKQLWKEATADAQPSGVHGGNAAARAKAEEAEAAPAPGASK